jgi:hypothetical protein
MAKQGDQEGARLLSDVIRPGNRSIRAPNHIRDKGKPFYSAAPPPAN